MLSSFLVVFLLSKTASAFEDVPDKEYALMPPLFHIDDYDRCMQHGEDAFYCELNFNLQPIDERNKSEVWKIVEKVASNPKKYRHDWLRHGVCVTTTCPNISKDLYTTGEDNKTMLMEALSECYSDKYKHLGVKGFVSRTHCETTGPVYPITVFDITVAICGMIFVCFLLGATIYEGLARYKTEEEYNRITQSCVGKIVCCFSVIKNWHRLRSENTTIDGKRMRCIQGMRFYNMICVIMAHVCMSVFHAPVSNPVFNERITDKTLNMFVANGGYVVQTFFAISGWLVAFHFFEMSEGKKEVSFGYIIFAFINRYIRLLPALVTVYLFSSTWIIQMGRGPYWDRVVGLEYRNCKNNGWSNLLFINNYYNKEEMCMQHTWYIAVDTQVFVIAIFVTWLMKNYEKYAMKIVLGAIAIATVIPMFVTYIYNFDILVRQYPEPLYNLLLREFQWHITFTSGYCNIAGYLVGVAFGYIFYKNRDKNLFTSRVYQVLWWMASWFFPVFVVLIAGIMYDEDFHYTRLGAAFYAGISRTLFPFGVALGIWGMSQRQGWFMRFFLEWNAVQVFGRLTYCAYLIHVMLLKIRLGKMRNPIYVTEYLLVYETLGDVTFAYLAATVLCVCVEMPVSALQKLMLPQRKAKPNQLKDRETNGSGKTFVVERRPGGGRPRDRLQEGLRSTLPQDIQTIY